MSNCCSCGSGCCDSSSKKKVQIDFLFLDLSVCTRCQGTDEVLEEAISTVKTLLNSAGTEVTVQKIHIDTKEKAIEHKFLSSPTIRVNGIEIDTDFKETNCESCGDLCGDSVDCRVWIYNNVEYTVPPKELIINAILKAVYSENSPTVDETKYQLPENLKHYYEALEKKS